MQTPAASRSPQESPTWSTLSIFSVGSSHRLSSPEPSRCSWSSHKQAHRVVTRDIQTPATIGLLASPERLPQPSSRWRCAKLRDHRLTMLRLYPIPSTSRVTQRSYPRDARGSKLVQKRGVCSEITTVVEAENFARTRFQCARGSTRKKQTRARGTSHKTPGGNKHGEPM